MEDRLTRRNNINRLMSEESLSNDRQSEKYFTPPRFEPLLLAMLQPTLH